MAAKEPPAGANIAAELRPGAALTADEAFAILVAQGDAPAPLTLPEQRDALAANIVDGRVSGIPVAALNTQEASNRTYTALEVSGAVPVAATPDEVAGTIDGFRHSDVFT